MITPNKEVCIDGQPHVWEATSEGWFFDIYECSKCHGHLEVSIGDASVQDMRFFPKREELPK